MNLKKEAQKDAYEYARAKMYYGEGAGTRRKLIKASVAHKCIMNPYYEEVFMDALNNQNMDNHVTAAHKERRRKDISKKVDRNIRGLSTGNKQSLTTGFAIISALGYWARQTGYDKKIESYVKMEYYKTKRWVKIKKAELKSRKKHKV